MRIEIENIKVAERIRKLTAGVAELAQDIQKNGLINPITVMTVDGGDGYQLLAGLRRLRAAQVLGWEEIEVTVVSPKDAEAALNIEYSENVQREAFTYSEKMDYARLIAEIEKAKARERQNEGGLLGGSIAGKGRPRGDSLEVGRPQGYGDESKRKPQSRDIVSEKIGLSAKQYERAKYIANHAPQEMIDELDRGERTIFGTYEELHANVKRAKSDAPAVNDPKESDLDRAIRAESELDAFKYRQHNEIFHRDNIIESLRKRVAELEVDVSGLEADVSGLKADVSGLEDALEAAKARIRELEGIHAAAL